MTPERWQRIEELYHTALERPLNERPAWLASACMDDAELRREIELLLAANAQAEGFLTAPALQLAAQSLAADEKPTQPLSPAIGLKLSHYKILSRIGAGGMGEVYLARDTSLERRVALKLLPLKFTQDPERLQRFIREAKAASALNHPNIITIYEIGMVEAERGQTHFIATEYIEGVTLREWEPEEERKRLSQVLELGIQIASALDAAHHAGIVHRDIKPENLMVRPDGLVKVLDFGLAKLTATNTSGDNKVDTDAQTTPAEMQTMPGMILGTLRYMSPEQARGRALDARTDIFSLGVVLYELLTRKPLFEGETSADVIAAIIHKEMPHLGTYLPDAPAELERILRKALAKDCRDRYQDARDLQIDFQALKQESELSARLLRSGQSGTVVSVASVPEKLPRRWLVLAGGILAGLLIGFTTWKLFFARPAASPRPTPRITRQVNERIVSGGGVSRVEFSPDGKLIAYSISKERDSSLWVKQIVGGEAKQITDGKWKDRDPIWSPDGQQLAFISDRGGTPGIWAVAYLGGAPALLKAIDLINGTLVAWAKNEQTIYYELSGNLFALERASGETAQLTSFALNNSSVRDFRVSLNEEKIAYAESLSKLSHIMVKPLRDGEPRQITFGPGSDRAPAWFPDGERIAFGSNRTGRYQIYLGWLDGREPEPLIVSDDDHRKPVVSAQGDRLVSIGGRENANIFSYDLRANQEVGHTSEFGIQLFPELSPDGAQVAFQASNTNVNLDEAIVLKPADPKGQPVQLTSPGFNARWSPAGDTLAFIRFAAGKSQLWKVSVSGRNEKLLASDLLISGQTGVPYYRLFTNFDWSPNGARIVYRSGKSGQENLWAVDSDGASETMLTKNTDQQVHISSPLWSPDGRRLVYVSGSLPSAGGGKKSLFVWEQGKNEAVFETEAPLRLIGWSAAGAELYLALGERGSSTPPQKIVLLKLLIAGKRPLTICQIPSAYLHSVTLSNDKQQIALVSRQDDKDNVEFISISSGSVKRMTGNNDTTTYYSGLCWSPDGKTLFYSKQTSWSFASLIENFR